MTKTARLLCILLLPLLMTACRQAPTHTLVAAEDSLIRIPLAEMRDGTAHFYTFRQGRKNINFLVRTDRTGKLHVSLDACYTCSKYRKGFRVFGEEIICSHCGTRFRLSDPSWKLGGCTPIDLPHRITESFLTVQVSDLAHTARIF
jgi:uncharacterized membrane protein